MKQPTDALWQAIESYDLTAIGSNIRFEDKLALDNGWTLGFATLVTAEYRKFLYLTQVAGRMVCPSDEVDQAWHLHLTQTDSYAEFCQEVLGGFLHHYASKGGPDELKRHQTMYRFTLDTYQEVFDHVPNPELWPSVKDRFFLIPKAGSVLDAGWDRTFFPYRYLSVTFLCVAVVGSLISMATDGGLSPQLSGLQFVFSYLIALFLLNLIPTMFGRSESLGLAQKALDAYEVAYLEGGANRVFGTAVTSLVDLGALKLTPQREKDKPDIKGVVCEKVLDCDLSTLPKLHPIEEQLLREWPEAPAKDQAAVAAKLLDSQIGEIHLRLVRAGLLQLPGKINYLRGLTAVLLLGLALIGSIRFWQGLILHHHVLFLGLLFLLTFFTIAGQLNKDGIASSLGVAVLGELKAEYSQLKDSASQPMVRHQINNTGTGILLVLGFALFGSQAVVASQDYAGINWVVGTGNTTGNSQSTAGCGGGGCGGGCGGCGGCGGGG